MSNIIRSVCFFLICSLVVLVVSCPAFTNGKVEPPVFDPEGGIRKDPVVVSMTCPTNGATIHYTIDETEPTSASPTYTEPLSVESSTIIKAYAIKNGMTDSEIVSHAYTLNLAAETPRFSPDPGAWDGAVSATLMVDDPDTVIHYSINGSDPTSSSPVYSAAILLNAGETITIKAIGVKAGCPDSPVASATYHIRTWTGIPFQDDPGTPTALGYGLRLSDDGDIFLLIDSGVYLCTGETNVFAEISLTGLVGRPTRIEIGPDGNLYILTIDVNNRFQVWRRSGATAQAVTSLKTVPGGASPEQICLALDSQCTPWVAAAQNSTELYVDKYVGGATDWQTIGGAPFSASIRFLSVGLDFGLSDKPILSYWECTDAYSNQGYPFRVATYANGTWTILQGMDFIGLSAASIVSDSGTVYVALSPMGSQGYEPISVYGYGPTDSSWYRHYDAAFSPARYPIAAFTLRKGISPFLCIGGYPTAAGSSEGFLFMTVYVDNSPGWRAFKYPLPEYPNEIRRNPSLVSADNGDLFIGYSSSDENGQNTTFKVMAFR